MRQKTRPKENSAAAVARAPWRVVGVRVLPKHRLLVRFGDGTEGEVDVAPMLFGPKPGVFEHLRDEARFAEAYVANGAVTWPGELDLAPDSMYDGIRARGTYAVRP